MRDFNDIAGIKIKLASPETIRRWSYGEVKKAETINYRTLRPERDGLFCEKIFGTTKEWECYCGKFKSIRYRGVVCDRCGIEVAHPKVRRERMGHIDLAVPVAHIWYYSVVPSKMGLLLDLTINDLRSVIYYEKYIVIDPGDADDLQRGDILSEDDYEHYISNYEEVKIGTGAPALKEMLQTIDLDELAEELRRRMVESGVKDAKLLKRLEIVEDFRHSDNKPEYMIIEALPVIPPDLRPIVQLEGSKFASSDLNDLYRRVINRNNRLKRLLALRAPDIIVKNEKRMLQEAVDSLFDNSRRRRPIKGKQNRPLKSLSDMLRGKQGRFRQNLLGKRVDYSGRSVIVIGPTLNLHQCGLPKIMALELFKPFVLKRLMDKGYACNIKGAKRLVEQQTKEVWEALEEVVAGHPVLLNRAPTLHRLGIQAFEPVLIEGKAITLHPLVCPAFNADFDGDQMAVHVPLSPKAQIESWLLMLSSNNLLNPADGSPIVYPTQDIVLGVYYLTTELPGAKGEGKIFADKREAFHSLENGIIDIRSKIKVYMRLSGKDKESIVETTVGRIIFNEILPEDYPYINYSLNDKALAKLVSDLIKRYNNYVVIKFLDDMKNLGFQYATRFAPTFSIGDVKVAKDKDKIIERALEEVKKLEDNYKKGIITEDERKNNTIDIWTEAGELVAKNMFEELRKDKNGFNPIYVMAQSGARGSKQQIRQLAGMRGLMAKPSGEIIEMPIRSNFREGLTVLEYFISTHGARKGLADTALKTADAGYLTRRLVDVSQDVVIREEDCGTKEGIYVKAVVEGTEVIESLKERIVGRIAREDIIDPNTGEIIVRENEEITEEIADKIDRAGIEEVKIRSVLTCESRKGVCAMCYGRDLGRGRMVSKGEAIGIIAAQSIGQPGTQLTMRTFHIGGAAFGKAEEKEIRLSYDVYVEAIGVRYIITDEGKKIATRRGTISVRKIAQMYDKQEVSLIHGEGEISIGEIIGKLKDSGKEIRSNVNGLIKVIDDKVLLLGEFQSLKVPSGALLYVGEGDIVSANTRIAEFEPFSNPIYSEDRGRVKFVDIELGRTLKEEKDEQTGVVNKVISEYKAEKMHPAIWIVDDKGEVIERSDGSKSIYYLPRGAILMIEDGDEVKPGSILAKVPVETQKVKDITGGLPRVVELFEARVPANAATVAEISGRVSVEGVTKDKRIVVITGENGERVRYLIPQKKQLRVSEGDWVNAGDQLDEGPINPHDILKIKGERALQEYLLNEIQAVYRMQGVTINDKHIEVIIRQMMSKVEIIDGGDTRFVIGQQVDKFEFKDENERVEREGGTPAQARPVLLGITRAALNTESFISAASFQETTKVLTTAAIKGKKDVLFGLKENIIIGKLIPAGTGFEEYTNVKIEGLQEEAEEELMEAKKSSYMEVKLSSY